MKILQYTSILVLLLLFAGCTDQPKGLVGIWSSGDAGFFSSQIILKLESDGSATMTGGTLFMSSSEKLSWKAKGDTLFLELNGKTTELEIISKSKTDLVLNFPSGGLVSFKRIGDPSQTESSAGSSRVDQDKAIRNHLRQIASAGQQYVLENGVNQVGYNTMVGDYFPPIMPVAGESYKELIVYEQGGKLSVTNKDGQVFEYTY